MPFRRLRWACLLLWCALAFGAHAAEVFTPVVLQEAWFQGVGDTHETAVQLPDTWGARKRPTTGSARYRLVFDLPSVPAGGLAARFTRISSTRQVTLNGHLIGNESFAGNEHGMADLLALSAPMLRVGRNELVLDMRYRNRGGLSDGSIALPAVQREAHEHALVLDRELPRALNMGMTALSLFLLLVWARRRSETTIGMFGLLAFLGSLRNYAYFAEFSLLPPPVTDWLFFSVQVWTIALFAGFARSLQVPRSQRPWVDTLLLVAGLGVPLAAVAAGPLGWMPWIRIVVYPLLVVGGFVSSWLLWQVARVRRDAIHVVLAIAFSCVILAGLHDHVFQQGLLPVTHSFWVPLVMPFAFGVYSVMTMSRLVTAVGEAERLNVELEQRVTQRTRALQNANATKSRFLASASHDLRQPVAAIGLMVSLLREQISARPLQAMIDRVDEAVASMETMLRGLLDLSRLESGTVRARPARVALQPLFDAIALHEAETAGRKGIRLVFRATPLAAQTDPVLLDQVLRNLVSNAVRYTERGGVLVTARARGAGDVLVQVWDTGIGIAPEDQSAVFEEFVQVGNAARQRTRGLGLGLSIVRRSAAVMGHPLGLRSVPGRGSCFSLRLPRGAAERRAAVRAVPHDPATRPLDGLRVLLVEDDDAVREGLAARLAAWGAVVQAFDGVPALRAALPPVGAPQRGDFTDLVITDQRLPGGSGLVVIELVRQRCGATRAMVVTGDTSPGDLTLLEASGVPVLHKPFRTEALLAAVLQATQSSPLGEIA
ncbi:ATP-binding protein [Rhizobacter sp. Root1221]|uniref:hybrid sensor histidine kinase/response regulator n=1 Tax=Rhizobacter sp. Root1221 TaxID=1736433 RepID=UPI0007002080|nr:ATP-binding protein [Rhizobacter sp. Root1221]KQV99563.1 hypothetical protein ASC87_02365 [Rhizobacter sp. Root1221]